MLEYDELKVEFEGYEPELKELAGALDLDNLKTEITKLEEQSAQPDFWNDVENSQKISQKIGEDKNIVQSYEKLRESYDDVMTMLELAQEEDDESMLPEIQELAKDIIFGQLRLIIATMDIEEINSDRDKFLLAVSNNVEIELKKIGLKLINVNVTDITDESGYLEALGKEAAAKAINDAKKSVAEKHRDGEIGQANAQKDQRIQVAAANASAIDGENQAKIEVAQSEALRREREAEALRQATAAEAVQAAKAKQEAYIAQQSAEQTRAELEKATQTADVIVKAQISKQQAEIEAEAQAEVVRRKAKGEADAIFAKMEAEAKGNQEILTKQAEGMRKLVEAAGGDANAAVKLIVADKIEELISIQVEAIKNIKIDKITVWDTGAGADGKGSTANFLSGLMQSVPPLNDLFKQAGMSLPDFLGEDIQEALKKSQEEAVKRAAEADNAGTLDPKDVEVIEPEK